MRRLRDRPTLRPRSLPSGPLGALAHRHRRPNALSRSLHPAALAIVNPLEEHGAALYPTPARRLHDLLEIAWNRTPLGS